MLEHPFFWDDEGRIAFLQEVSDRLEKVDDRSPILALLDSGAGVRGWADRVPEKLLLDAGAHRRYSSRSARDCLRMIRNKCARGRGRTKPLLPLQGWRRDVDSWV